MKQRAEQNQTIASPILPNSAPVLKKQAEKHKEAVVHAQPAGAPTVSTASVAPWNEKASPVNKASGKSNESMLEIQKQEQERAAAIQKQKVAEQQQRGLKVILNK